MLAAVLRVGLREVGVGERDCEVRVLRAVPGQLLRWGASVSTRFVGVPLRRVSRGVGRRHGEGRQRWRSTRSGSRHARAPRVATAASRGTLAGGEG